MHVDAYAPFGAEGIVVRVEADIRRGIPGVDVTGLAAGAVREARDRVRAAFRNSGYAFPLDRVLVNLAPAGFRKDGAALDLPIAIAVMAAAGLCPDASGLMVLGELELSGRVRPVRGVLAAAAAGLRAGCGGFVVPRENAADAAVLAPGRVAAVGSLREAAEALERRAATGSVAGGSFPREQGDGSAGPHGPRADGRDREPAGDFCEVRGQERYKRALELCAAGGHNLLAFGPPGSGKTMLARRLRGILPPLDPEAAVEAARLRSLAGLSGEGLDRAPPFRSPHHSASPEGILGGGRTIRPGEISLAHRGVLFLDEAPEFRADVLSSLREPLEEGWITISRADGSARLPASFRLVLAANPCPCGRLGAAAGDCFCSSEEVRRHWRRLGGALLDRIELRVPLRPPGADGIGGEGAEPTSSVARRVAAAAGLLREAAGSAPASRLGAGAVAELRRASAALGFSARACDAAARVALAAAALDGRSSATEADAAEAVSFRRWGDDPYDAVCAFGTMPSP